MCIAHRRETSNALNANRNVFRNCLKLFLPITGFRKLSGPTAQPHRKLVGAERVARYDRELSGGGSEMLP